MFGAFGPAYCECGPNADWFVQEWFSDCIYTTWELVAFWIGMSSVLFWIIAQLPQFISNLKNQTAEALSPGFLFQWLAGDWFNLLGCIVTGDQLATQTFTATYFVFPDFVIVSQYVYYSMRDNEREAFEEKDQGSSSLARDCIAELKDSLKETSSEFRKRLPKITNVVPDLTEDVEVNHEAQHEGCEYHPVNSVAGRSGAAMISHTMRSPQVLHSPHEEPTSNAFQTSESKAVPHSPERGRPKDTSLQPNPNAQYHPVTVTDCSASSMIAHDLHSHSPKAPHNANVDHINRVSHISLRQAPAAQREGGGGGGGDSYAEPGRPRPEPTRHAKAWTRSLSPK